MAFQQRQHQRPQLLPFAIPLECLQESGCMITKGAPTARLNVSSNSSSKMTVFMGLADRHIPCYPVP